MEIDVSEYQKLIESALAKYPLPDKPGNLYDPLRYFLTLGGKRMRPVLTLMGSELFDSDISKAESAAIGIELFHNFTLIHDDIMDEAPLRRGKETVHTKWNENIAILSGDVLFVEAYKKMSNYEPELVVKILPVFNETAELVCQGQQMDMDFEVKENVSIDEYIEMIRLKTAVLLGCSLKIGGLIGGASDTDADDLYRFGVNLGIAFQLQDDILDVYADDSKFGKQVGGDIVSNKKTFLLLKAIELADNPTKDKLVKSLAISEVKSKVSAVKEIYSELNIKGIAEDKMNDFYSIAIQNLDHINLSDEKKAPLRGLANFLMNREV